MSKLLEIEGLTKRFGPITAVDDISFSVDRGEVLGFLGPNGAGKSTAMKMITGFLSPTAGKIVVCGHDVRRHPIASKRQIGYLPEGAPLYGDMTPQSAELCLRHSRSAVRAAPTGVGARDRKPALKPSAAPADRDAFERL